MATTLGETTRQSNSSTLARNGDKALFVRSFDELRTNDTSTNGDGRTSVVLVRPLSDSDVLEALCPDGECTGTGGTSKEVVAFNVLVRVPVRSAS